MSESIIKFDKVSYQYDTDEPGKKGRKVLDEVSFEIEKGSFVAILGHNGSGKSTLSKLTNSIYVPTSGKITVNGMDTSDENLTYDIRQTVGLVFQNPDNQIVASIVEEDVAFGPENIGVAPKEIRERVDDALKSVGMYEYKDHETHKLSGGQKQRIAIAGIVAMRPECIVLDEPTAMLDPQGRREIMKTVQDLNKNFGITIIYVTHYMEEAAKADRILVMDKGKLTLDGTPREVFDQVQYLKSIGLAVPQSSELAFYAKKDGLDIEKSVLNVKECVDAIINALENRKDK